MKSWKARLMALLVAVAMIAVVQGPVMAQDCEFIGFDGDEAIFVCEVDVDFDGIDDAFDDFIDADFDGFDDRFFFEDDDDCIGVEGDSFDGDGCVGVGSADSDDDFFFFDEDDFDD